MGTESLAYEHRQIERIAGDLRAAGLRNDVTGARRRLMELFLAVLGHATRESVAIRLAESRCGSSELVLLQSFRRTGEAMEAELRRFDVDWADAARIAADLDRFRMELDHLLARLGRRMMEAERKVFPLVEALTSDRACSWASDESDEHTVRISRDALLAAGLGRR